MIFKMYYLRSNNHQSEYVYVLCNVNNDLRHDATLLDLLYEIQSIIALIYLYFVTALIQPVTVRESEEGIGVSAGLTPLQTKTMTEKKATILNC